MDTAHSLFESIGIPRQIVIDHQSAELKINALCGSISRHHDLCCITEVLFLFPPIHHFHATVDHGDLHTEPFQMALERQHRILELAEDEQLLLRVTL